MRFALATTVFTAMLAAASGQGPKDPTLGQWTVESLIRDGKAEDAMKGATRTHDGSKYSIVAKNATGPIEGTYTVDVSKLPITIEMKPASGQYKDKTLSGIVKVDGDTLTIAFAPPGQDRPKTFESKAGTGVVLVVHKKAK